MDNQTRMVASAARDAMTEILGLEQADEVMDGILKSPAFSDELGAFVQCALVFSKIRNERNKK